MRGEKKRERARERKREREVDSAEKVLAARAVASGYHKTVTIPKKAEGGVS